MGKRKFKKAVKALGKKYGQDAVITQTKGKGGATLKLEPARVDYRREIYQSEK